MFTMTHRKQVSRWRLLLESLEGRSMLATITVDSALDNFDANAPTTDGQVTLREAILAANSDVPVGDAPAGKGADSIEFAAGLNGVTIALNAAFGQLSVTQPTLVNASSLSGGLTIDAQGHSRVFNIFSVGDVTLTGVTLTGGAPTGASNDGGAILALTRLVLKDSLVTGNSAGNGGGIYVGHFATIQNTTISGNSAQGAGGGIFVGGGGRLILNQSTVTGNTAGHGGGIVTTLYSLYFSTLNGSVVSGNLAGIASPDLSFDVIQASHNLIGSTSGLSPSAIAQLNAGTGNLINVNPLLAPLADNGGRTKTHALLSGSPAIDAGDPSAVAGMGGIPLFDQRGAPFGRVEDGDGDLMPRIDMGAHEVQFSTVDGDFNDDGLYDCFDINGLVAEIAAGTNNPAFDLTADGVVDLADRNAWLIEGGMNNPAQTGGNPFVLADANLDGFVDGSDFGVWNSNKFTMQAAWCSGDFSADGGIDGSDFNIWNSNKFTSSDGSRGSFVSNIAFPSDQQSSHADQFPWTTPKQSSPVRRRDSLWRTARWEADVDTQV